MSYMKFDSLTPVNETVSTMLVQLGQNIKQLFNTDNYTSARKNFQNYLNAKKDYFDEMFVITPRLQSMLLKWIKKIPGAFSIPANEVDQFLNVLEVDKEVSGGTYDGYGAVNSYDVVYTKEYILHNKATATNNKNSFTNATCTYLLKDGNKCYVLFFTFDSDDISVAQVLTKNKYANTTLANGFDIVEIPEWSGVDPREYIR